MRAIAFTYVYNEVDIIRHAIRHMIEQSVEVYVLDNWSTDGTWEVLQQLTYEYQGVLHVERFPDAPPQWFDLAAILKRIEALCGQLKPQWGLVFGADETLEPPWPGTTLLDALKLVDVTGHTVVDFVTACFHPVDDGWTPEDDPVTYFQHWTRGRYQINVRAFRADKGVEFLLGGHDVAVPGRSLYPFKFIIRHYPFRTQAQAERKVFQERRPRYDPDARRRGWHTHLDHIQPGYSFVHDAAGLTAYDPATFYQEMQR